LKNKVKIGYHIDEVYSFDKIETKNNKEFRGKIMKIVAIGGGEIVDRAIQ
jgi:hypothetical protein